jgi:pilus assembly protein Flp/PilA
MSTEITSLPLSELKQKPKSVANLQFNNGRFSMSNLVQKFLRDESGVTAIEYGLIAALVAVGAVSAFSALGGKLGTVFNGVSTKMTVPA